MVVGSGNPKPYRELCSRNADRVIFTGERRDVEDLYAAADCLVLPSAYETFSMVCMEAMASGLAVFATRVGGIEDYLVDGVNGYAIEPNGVDIACKLAKALNDDEHLAALREGAVATATIYSWDRVGIASADLLFEVWHEKYAPSR